jgi:pimeloyl-ACP methyl ester carboxylesterase
MIGPVRPPPTPPVLCPSCERAECLLWRRERLRLLNERALHKAINFGMSWGGTAATLVDYARKP